VRTRFVLLVGLALIPGCARSKYAPVSGKVTMDGKPLADVVVMFQPSGDTLEPVPGSTRRTNENGEYTLTVVGEGINGAVIGPHTV
jgi:hypothetical protein